MIYCRRDLYRSRTFYKTFMFWQFYEITRRFFKAYHDIFSQNTFLKNIFRSFSNFFIRRKYLKKFIKYIHIFSIIFSNGKYYFQKILNIFLKNPQNIFRHITAFFRKYFSLSLIDLFAVRDTNVSALQSLCVRMNLAVTRIRHLAVLVGGFAFADAPGEHEINDDDNHEAQVDHEHYGHPVEPFRGLHLPDKAAQHTQCPSVAPCKYRIHMASDAVSVARSFARQARIMACDAEYTGFVVIPDRVSPGRALSQAAAVIVVPIRFAH